MKALAAVFACVLAFAATLALSGAARAAGGCYGVNELEAEQGLRIHSELMVIGLTCVKMPGGRELYSKYAAFTRNNQDLLSGYENTMLAYFSQQGQNPEKSLHSLRTELANGISKHTIRMGTLTFCQRFSPRIDAALIMNRDKLRRWARHVWPGTPVSRPMCG